MKKILLIISSLIFFLLFNINAHADSVIGLSGSYYFCFGTTFADIDGSTTIVSGDVGCTNNYSGDIKGSTTAHFLPSANYPVSGGDVLFGAANTFDVTLTPSSSLTTGNTYKLDIVLFSSSTNGHKLDLYNSGSFQGWNGSNWSSNYISSKSISTSYDKGSGKVYISILFTLSNNVSRIFYQMKSSNVGAWVWNSNVGNDNAYYFISSNLVKVDNPSDALLEEQINQNNTIINQNDTIINQNTETNNKLDDINDSLTDETPPDTSGLSGAAGWLPAGPVDSLINLPLAFFNSISRDLGSSCKPVKLPLPYVNKDLTLPCMSSFYEGIKINSFIDWVGLIASAFILFSYLLKLYKWVDDTLTFRENNHLDNWGGV